MTINQLTTCYVIPSMDRLLNLDELQKKLFLVLHGERFNCFILDWHIADSTV
jgi:hypothetical protein